MSSKRVRRLLGVGALTALLSLLVLVTQPPAPEPEPVSTLSTPSDFGADPPLVTLAITISDTAPDVAEATTVDTDLVEAVLAVAAVPATSALPPVTNVVVRNPFAPVRIQAPATTATGAPAVAPAIGAAEAAVAAAPAAVPRFDPITPETQVGLSTVWDAGTLANPPEPLTRTLLGVLHRDPQMSEIATTGDDPTATLHAFVLGGGLSFTGTVAGPTSVAVFRRAGSDTPWVVPVGGRLPNSDITLSNLQTTQASLTLGDATFVLELDTRR